MDDTTRAELDAIRKRVEAATDGPWKAEMHGQNVLACDDQMMICNVRGWGYLTGIGALNLPEDDAVAIMDANTRMIAASRTDIPRLLTIIDEHKDSCIRARALLKKLEIK